MSLRANITANFLGQGWIAVLNFAVVPVNLHFLGAESFGLLGVYTSLSAIFALLDLGLGAALNRELARLTGVAKFGQDMANLTRTLEVLYVAVGVAIAAVSCLMAPFVARHWLNLNRLSAEDAATAFGLIGVLIASRWPMALYQGAMSGLQQQVRMNLWRACIETARLLGGVCVLAFLSPTIHALLAWNVACALAGSLAGAALTWRLLPKHPSTPVFTRTALHSIWRYAAGMSVLAVTTVVLTQVDKIILSKVLPLEYFGYYTLATTITISLWLLLGPIQSAVYPKLCELVARESIQELEAVFHKACKLAALAVLPLAAVIAAFPNEAIFTWTNNAAAAAYAGPILRVLMIGASLASILTIPHNLQLASGWLAAPIRLNIAAIALVLPAAYLAAERFGGVGVAFVLLGLNIFHVLTQTWLIFAPLGNRMRRQWLRRDAVPPFLAVYACAILLGQVVPVTLTQHRIGMAIWLAICVVASTGIAFLSLNGSELLSRKVAAQHESN